MWCTCNSFIERINKSANIPISIYSNTAYSLDFYMDRATQFTIVPSHYRVWVDGTMTRWRDTDYAIEHCVIAIVLSHHRHRVIAPLPSNCRAIASSLSQHRAIVIAHTPSSSHHCVNALSPHTRWCDGDGELRGPIRIATHVNYEGDAGPKMGTPMYN